MQGRFHGRLADPRTLRSGKEGRPCGGQYLLSLGRVGPPNIDLLKTPFRCRCRRRFMHRCHRVERIFALQIIGWPAVTIVDRFPSLPSPPPFAPSTIPSLPTGQDKVLIVVAGPTRLQTRYASIWPGVAINGSVTRPMRTGGESAARRLAEKAPGRGSPSSIRQPWSGCRMDNVRPRVERPSRTLQPCKGLRVPCPSPGRRSAACGCVTRPTWSRMERGRGSALS